MSYVISQIKVLERNPKLEVLSPNKKHNSSYNSISINELVYHLTLIKTILSEVWLHLYWNFIPFTAIHLHTILKSLSKCVMILYLYKNVQLKLIHICIDQCYNNSDVGGCRQRRHVSPVDPAFHTFLPVCVSIHTILVVCPYVWLSIRMESPFFFCGITTGWHLIRQLLNCINDNKWSS